MVDGISIRAIARMTGASKNTVAKLLEGAGEAFSDYQDRTLRGLTCKRIQVDEIWAFVCEIFCSKPSTCWRLSPAWARCATISHRREGISASGAWERIS
jgi:transposase